MTQTANSNLTEAQCLDANDPLANRRDHFLLPAEQIYLNGNSLGPLPVAAQQQARVLVEQQWGEDLISSWNKHGWIDMPVACGEKLAPLLGAAPGQVVCCDSVSINLFKLLTAALTLNETRSVVLSTSDNFPTDLYMVQGLQELLGEQRCQLRTVATGELSASLDSSVAVLMLTQVDFRSGAMLDIRKLTAKAHEVGALVLWDLSHSAGVVPLQLDSWDVDFAVGCGYKYLNGGPGAPAFLYVNARLQADIRQPLCGWMGHKAPFDFTSEYEQAGGIARFLTGTPPILSMGVLSAALDVFAGIDAQQLRDKSLALANTFLASVDAIDELKSLQLISPRDPEQRGGQLAYAHDEAYAICQALAAQGVQTDFRSPNLLRFGFSPLFLSHVDVVTAVQKLQEVITQQRYVEPQFRQRKKVT